MLSCLLEVCSEPRRSFCRRVSSCLARRWIQLIIGIHPATIAQSFQKAAAKSVEFLEDIAIPVDLNDRESLLRAAGTSLNSKVSRRGPTEVTATLNVRLCRNTLQPSPRSP